LQYYAVSLSFVIKQCLHGVHFLMRDEEPMMGGMVLSAIMRFIVSYM